MADTDQQDNGADTDDTSTDTGADQQETQTDDELVTLRNENNRLKREAADAAKAARKAQQDKAKKDGDFESLAKEKEREAEEARKEAEDATRKLADYERQRTISTSASSLDFADGNDAVVYLTNPASAYYVEPDKQDNKTLVEAALKRLKKDKPGLIAAARRTSRDSDDEQDNSGLTPEQQHARWLASKF
jgi:hypothetical protein